MTGQGAGRSGGDGLTGVCWPQIGIQALLAVIARRKKNLGYEPSSQVSDGVRGIKAGRAAVYQ